MGIFGMLLGSSVLITCVFARFRRLRVPEGMGLLAIGCLLTLIGVRAISLHSVDNILDRHIFGLQVGWYLEALILIWIAGALLWKEPQSSNGS